jgi:hypothetical protein
MQGVAGLVKDDGWKIQQVKTCLDEFGVADDHLHPVLNLSRIPFFSFRGIDIRPQNGCTDAFVAQDSF